jgi:hypothetical protein
MTQLHRVGARLSAFGHGALILLMSNRKSGSTLASTILSVALLVATGALDKPLAHSQASSTAIPQLTTGLISTVAGQYLSGAGDHSGAGATASLRGQSLERVSQPAPGSAQAAAQAAHAPSGPVARYLKLPLRFEANRGQADQRVRFISRGLGYNLFLTSREAVLVLATPVAKQSAPGDQLQPEATASPRTPPAVVRLELTGANRRPAITEEDPLPTKSNYFIGNDPNKWRTKIPNYAQVRYRDVYPGIDLIYYGNQRRLEHDFVVAPGADPGRIALGLRGVSKLRIEGGDLVMSTAQGELRLLKPEIYQSLEGSRHSVPGGYVFKGDNRVGFEVAEFDHRRPLVIDPVLSYSTFLGGDYSDRAFGIALDSSGNAYVTGVTFSSDFPVTSGAFQTTLLANIDGCSNGEKVIDGGQGNGFVAKLNSTGTALIYSTYVGGTCADAANAIAVDSSGNAYITGVTGSTNFPTTSGAFQTSKASTHYNAFVTKLNSTGTALLYSTYLGGNVIDEGNGIALDSGGNAYVTGETNSTNFPTTSGAFQTSIANSDDYPSAFVSKFNPTGTALVYSTYLGGNGGDEAFGIALDSSGNAYITGLTASTNFPTTSGAFRTTLGSSNGNAFVTKLNSTGAALLYSTYLGGSGGDNGNGIAVDSSGNAYVTGLTSSTDFPTTSGAFQTALAGTGNAFVTKLNSSGAALLYSTYLGGSGGASGYSIAVDSSGNAYVTGATSSTVFPTTSGAIQTTLGTIYGNAFVTELNSTGSALVYSTYLGGSGNVSAGYGDAGLGIALNSSGNAYVTGLTASANFPVTPGAFQTVQSPLGNPGKLYAAFVAEIVPSNLTNQTITVTTAAPASADDNSTFMVAATASSDLPVSIAASGACSGSGTGSATITMTAATGTCTVTYSQAGNSTYAAAPTVTSMTTATAAALTSQTITVTTAAPASAADNSTFMVAATASSDLPVSIAASGACTGSGTGSATITMTAATGTCTVTYTQEGDSTYAAAPTVTSMTTATAATLTSQTITVTTAAPASAADNSTFMVAATASSDLPVSIAASGACTGSGTGSATITMTAATGTCTVTYTQAGNSTYAAAPTVTSSTTATAAALTSQTITVTTAAPASAADNSTFMVAATASSDLPVSIAASGACTGSGAGSATITMTAATGTCTVTYAQAGNSTYAAAPTVTSLTQATSTAPAPTFTLSSTTGAQAVQPGASAQYIVTAAAQNGTFPGSITFTANGLPAGATATFNPSSVTPGSSSATSQLTIQTAASTARLDRRGASWPLAAATLPLLGLCFGGTRRRRWLTLCLLLFASLGTAATLSGCGGGFGIGNNLPAAQNYTITVTGTSGAEQQTTTVQLTVE